MSSYKPDNARVNRILATTNCVNVMSGKIGLLFSNLYLIMFMLKHSDDG